MSANLLPFDLETYSAKDLHRRADFIRLAGYDNGEACVTTSVKELMGEMDGRVVVGHNICAYDLVALARHEGLSLPGMLGNVVDTDILARLIDPPPSGKEGVSTRPKGYYSLDETARRFGVEGKTASIQELARRYKGIDNIPADLPEFHDYLRGDVAATKALFGAMRRQTPWPDFWRYASREMRVGVLTAQMTCNGLRVDVPELERILAAQDIRKQEMIADISRVTGMPTMRKTGPEPEGVDWSIKSPVNTDAGREAISAWLVERGIPAHKIPRTDKTGKPAIGGDNITRLIELSDDPEVHRVIRECASVVGERTIYATANDCRVGDRLYPQIRATQASGRWSVTSPGLTVFGKREGRHVERRVVIPDEGHRLLSLDLDQVDARAVAAHSQDPGYMAIFQRGEDLHTSIAVACFGDPSMRELAKPIGHGWNYGRSVDAIAKSGVPLAAAIQYDQEMRKKYPRLVRWQEMVRARAARGGLLDNGFGRKMRSDPRFAYTQAPALVGQGASRDILAEGLLRIPLEFWPYLRVIVHDEIVLSCPARDAEEIGREVVKAMTFEFRGVPITSGCSKPSPSWAACYDK